MQLVTKSYKKALSGDVRAAVGGLKVRPCFEEISQPGLATIGAEVFYILFCLQDLSNRR